MSLFNPFKSVENYVGVLINARSKLFNIGGELNNLAKIFIFLSKSKVKKLQA